MGGTWDPTATLQHHHPSHPSHPSEPSEVASTSRVLCSHEAILCTPFLGTRRGLPKQPGLYRAWFLGLRVRAAGAASALLHVRVALRCWRHRHLRHASPNAQVCFVMLCNFKGRGQEQPRTPVGTREPSVFGPLRRRQMTQSRHTGDTSSPDAGWEAGKPRFGRVWLQRPPHAMLPHPPAPR